jgi:adenosylcobinamide-GDP ribazoletransferase
MSWPGSGFAAFRFLTVFPLPSSLGRGPDDLPGATFFFPVVGLTLGLLACGSAWLLWHVFPPPVAAVLLVFLVISFSGALHLDGLADTADGFFSARDRSRTLEIMRDSRIGVMGVVALIMALLLKVSSFAVMDSGLVLRASLIMPLAGRCALLLAMAVLPYARQEGGLGTLFYSRHLRPAAATGMIALFVVSAVVMGAPGLAAAAVVCAATLLFSWFCRLKIGGATGDTLGAACEIAETVLLVFLAAVPPG